MKRMTTMMTTILALLGTACGHRAQLDTASATFEAARLDQPTVERERVEFDGHAFDVESSMFVYEVSQPFHSVQFLATISLVDEQSSWSPTGAETTAVLDAALRELESTLPGLRCEPSVLTDDGSIGECATDDADEPYWLRARAVAAPRGVVLQLASWTHPQAKAWCDTFWSSLEVSADSATPGSEAEHSVNSRALLGEHLGQRVSSLLRGTN